MRHVRWASWAAAVATVLVVGAPHATRADVTSDQAAAIVVWPIVSVTRDTDSLAPFADDTLIQLSNTSTKPVVAHCFYLNANSHCSNSGDVCQIGAQCCGEGGCGFCLPAWNETDFDIVLTARQPIAWEASDGLSDFCSPNAEPGEPCIPLDGTSRKGPLDPTAPSGVKRFQSNAGTRILPVPETPFQGELKCIVIDQTSGEPVRGTAANVLIGQATLETAEDDSLDVAKYNAIGIKALAEGNSDPNPNVLTLQNSPAGQGDYEGCPNVIILNHFFDAAINPADDNLQIFTWPVFVPCTENLLQQIPGAAIAQYLVFNEFEQRFSTSNTVQCFRATGLSSIDTTQPENSIFNVGVAGTLVGQTRVTPIGSGLLAVALEFHATDSPVLNNGNHSADVNVHYQGQRSAADRITLP
jgi:hypothetical protein